MADKRESGEVQPEIPEDKQGPDQHEPTIEDRPRLGSDKELQKLDEWWLRYSQDREREQEHELQRKNAEIQHLTIALMREKTERAKVKERVRIYRAIEYILSLTKMRGMVPFGMNVEAGLYELIEQREFTEILLGEAQARGLVPEDLVDCAKSIYFELHPPGGDLNETFVIRDTDFTEKERAALIAFMKLQSEWSNSLSWREDVSGKASEGNVQGCP